jgi:release factor glutamine methyltransferase
MPGQPFQTLINKRARRIPLQHLTGRAHFRYLELEVGPGVFVPRPETEVMTGWAIEQLRPMVYAWRVVNRDTCRWSSSSARARVQSPNPLPLS